MSKRAFRFGNGSALLRQFVDRASVPTFLASSDGGAIIYANQACCDLLGFSRDELVGLELQALIQAEDSELATSQMGDLLAGRIEGYQAERRYVRKDGASEWVLVSVTKLSDGKEGTTYVAIQAVSIGRQKEAERALIASERRWNFALESAGQGVWEADLANDRVYYSPMWRQMRGYEPDEPIDSSAAAWLSRVHPDDRAHILDTIERQNSGEIKFNTFEYRERHKDGHYIWISSYGAPDAWAADGRPIRMIGTDSDITQRKLAEETARGLAHRLQAAMQVSGIGVFEGNLATGELFWDERIHEIFGIPPGGGPMRHDDWERALHPEDAPEAVAGLARGIMEKGTFSQKYRILRPTGEVRTIMAHATYLQDREPVPARCADRPAQSSLPRRIPQSPRRWRPFDR